MDWSQAKDEILKYLALGGATLLLYQIRALIASIDKIKESLIQFNISMESLSEHVNAHREELDEHDYRISRIERIA